MTITYTLSSGLPAESTLTPLIELLSRLFTDPDRDALRTKLTYQAARTGLLIQIASVDQELVGCKIGYERKAGHFYSWLGGVHTDFRGRGIAGELMRRQHEWCRQNGYHTVRTQTYNRWRDMLLLNLRFGFDITGTLQGKHGLIIVLEKRVL